MLTRLAELLGGIPVPVVVGLLVVGLTQLTLQAYGLVDLARRRTVPGGRKWVWALVIVLGSLVGAVVYLVVGRATPPLTDDESAPARTEARRRAIDRLYGGDV